jgi:hypothetical protein
MTLKYHAVFALAGALFLSSLGGAAPISSCASDFSSCDVYENQPLTLPGIGIAGDVAVISPETVSIIDVFRIFNNIVDTGAGTGLGNLAYMYSTVPPTLSANVVFILRANSGIPGYYETNYNGNGTIYHLFTPAPEPTTWALLCLGVPLFAGFRVWKQRRARA